MWTEKLVGTIVKSVPTLISLVPERHRKDVTARLNDRNPFASLGASNDLLRVLRIAWIESALEVDRAVLSACQAGEGDGQTSEIHAFSSIFTSKLKGLRTAAFDRRISLVESPIDDHFECVLVNAPATLLGKDPASADPLTRDFREIAAKIVGCQPHDVPDLYPQAAEAGVVTHLSTDRFTFGDLVYLVFLETIQTPNKYHQAEKAFQIAVTSLGVELGRQCLKALEGVDERIDNFLHTLDNLPTSEGLQAWLNDIEESWERSLGVIGSQIQEVGSKVDQSIAVVQEQGAQTNEILSQLTQAVKQHLSSCHSLVSDDAILELAKRLRPGDLLSVPQALKEIEFAISVVEEASSQGTAALYRDRLVKDTMSGVRQSIETGQFEQGALSIDQALASLERQEAEARESIGRQRSTLLSASIKQFTLLRNPQRVADDVVRLVSLEQSESPFLSERFRKELDTYFRQGEDLGVNFPLEVAIMLSRRWLDQAVESQGRCEALLSLGKSLAVLGERMPQDTFLQQAALAFREAVTVSNGSYPDSCAHAQNCLGGVLRALGDRERGSDMLHEAIDTFQSPMQYFTETGNAVMLAIVRSNLGATLLCLGEREGGVDRLREAVSILQNSLFEPVLRRLPIIWARAQNNLGNALRILGERECNVALLQQAAQAYQAALLERRQECVPLEWASTQNNLANVLQALGEQTNNIEFYHQAVEVYHSALTQQPREHVPLEWATTHHNLAYMHLQLAARERNSEWLYKAKEAALAALEERKRSLVPMDWARTTSLLGNVLLDLGDREDDPILIDQAISAYQKSLEERTRERVPMDWAMTKHNLGNALLTRAEFDNGTGFLEAAVEAYQSALLERTFERGSAAWGRTTAWLGDAFFALGDKCGDMRYVGLAVQNYRDALPHLSSNWAEVFSRKITSALKLLDEHPPIVE